MTVKESKALAELLAEIKNHFGPGNIPQGISNKILDLLFAQEELMTQDDSWGDDSWE